MISVVSAYQSMRLLKKAQSGDASLRSDIKLNTAQIETEMRKAGAVGMDAAAAEIAAGNSYQARMIRGSMEKLSTTASLITRIQEEVQEHMDKAKKEEDLSPREKEGQKIREERDDGKTKPRAKEPADAGRARGKTIDVKA